MTKRSLYMCANAKVNNTGEEVYCSEGHVLSVTSILPLARGAPLELTCCQSCQDYDEMGPPVPKKERGWSKSRSK